MLVLFYEEQELEPEYMTTLVKFLIRILQGGNVVVQNTIYEFFLSNSSCEKLFQRVSEIMNKQITSVNTAHKLNVKELKLIQKTIKILQLLCEGHNNELQNYLHYQSNQKNSYDLVSLSVQLLSSLHISNSNFELVMQCFETLTEVIQGPCRQNQITIGNSKFLEYAVQVLGEDEKIFELLP